MSDDRHTISNLEYLRNQSRQIFDKVRGTWIELGQWALPHRTKWLLSQEEGERTNHHIVDPTHIIALRSFVAGFLEGNTSVSRPWLRVSTGNRELDLFPANHAWLDFFTQRVLRVLSHSNFYDTAGAFYYDYGVFNTGALAIEEMQNDTLYWHNLDPGSYYIINNGYGESTVMVREFEMRVKELVDWYGKKVDGKPDWSNFSPWVRKMYEDGQYVQKVKVVNVIKENEFFDTEQAVGGVNRKWVSLHYELGTDSGPYYQQSANIYAPYPSSSGSGGGGLNNRFLKISYSKRKPFIVGKSHSSSNFEYGEKGPTLDALGLIKSLNKKAISKDMAIEKMLEPAIQGPASLRKSYINTNARKFIPLDVTSASGQGLRRVYEVDPRIAALVGDVIDMRQQVDKLYYSDYLLYLSQNPKTRTATETQAIVNEQQIVIGPNLQSLNYTFNTPVVEYVMDYVLDKDPYLPPAPPDLEGHFLRPEFISVFAQAQRAADLPQIERYVSAMMDVGQLNPQVFDKVNLDRLADLYEDRLYLPAGLNNPQEQVEALRQQARQQQARQQQLEAAVAEASAAKDASAAIKNVSNQGG